MMNMTVSSNLTGQTYLMNHTGPTAILFLDLKCCGLISCFIARCVLFHLTFKYK